MEISCGGVVIVRHDIATTHEEADNIIVQQAIRVAINEQKHVTILADDTDVYVLLLHHYLEQNLQLPMIMASPIRERKVIDIQATVAKHRDIIPSLVILYLGVTLWQHAMDRERENVESTKKKVTHGYDWQHSSRLV